VIILQQPCRRAGMIDSFSVEIHHIVQANSGNNEHDELLATLSKKCHKNQNNQRMIAPLAKWIDWPAIQALALDKAPVVVHHSAGGSVA
jgi:5-methylcytosine-specific restriction endonuclease McrA